MPADPVIEQKTALLDQLAQRYETSVTAFPAGDYLRAFCDFYEIKGRDLKLIPAPEGFHAALRELSGDDVWQPIARETERLFGPPRRVTVFEDDKALRDELEGPEGLAPFFFVFDLMFCEYEGFTLSFLSGTNN